MSQEEVKTAGNSKMNFNHAEVGKNEGFKLNSNYVLQIKDLIIPKKLYLSPSCHLK
jgi:hypothetical protein